MLKAVSNHKRAAQLMSDGHAEESLFWTDPETGIQCKARPDFIREGHILVDLKTTEDASYRSFQKDIVKFSYHFQAAMYLDAATAVFERPFDTFIIIAVEKNPPYAVQCFQLDETAIREGQELYYAALKKLKPCLESKIYPAYGNDLIPVALPTYAVRGEL
jgi:exodeoxyribonuclease VIII